MAGSQTRVDSISAEVAAEKTMPFGTNLGRAAGRDLPNARRDLLFARRDCLRPWDGRVAESGGQYLSGGCRRAEDACLFRQTLCLHVGFEY